MSSSFIVVVLVAAIAINLSYIVLRRLFKYLSKKIPNICESVLLRIQKRLRPQETMEEIPCHEYNPFHTKYLPDDEPVKTLQRRINWRRRTHLYLTHLGEGRGSPIEQTLWKTYEHYVPLWARRIDTESAIPDPLPAWLEVTIRVYQNIYVWRVAQLLTLYVILVLSSHLWLPHAIALFNTTDVVVSPLDALRINVTPCYNATTTYCYAAQGDEEMIVTAVAELRNMTQRHYAYDAFLYNQSQWSINEFLVDDAYRLYVALRLLVTPRIKTSSFWSFGYEAEIEETTPLVTRRYVEMKDTMPSLLEQLYTEESQYVCLCAPFLNIFSNVTFYRDEHSVWHTLLEPVIVRNNTFSDLILSSVRYSENSLFYAKDAFFKRLVPHLSDERMHHDSFVVEYSEVNLPDSETMHNLTEMSETLRRTEGGDPLRLFAYANDWASRKRVYLSGKDAICFVYCNALNDALPLIH